MESEYPIGPLCTRTSLATEFKNLGLQPGDTLLLHASLSSLGWVCGGAESVVQSLLDVLGETGTLVVPTHTPNNSDPARWKNPPVDPAWWRTIREHTPAFNTATTPSTGMGIIAETVRTWPGAKRSNHPHTSFAALGRDAEAITEVHDLDCSLGEKSPLGTLKAREARVLLLGVGFEACTAFHMAEYGETGLPMGTHFYAVRNEQADDDKGREWVEVQDAEFQDDDFEELGMDFEAECEVEQGSVGGAETKLFGVADAVDFAKIWMSIHRGE